MPGLRSLAATLAVTLLASGSALADNPGQGQASSVPADTVFAIRTVATLSNPWAMAFMPNHGLLVTEKSGNLRIVYPDEHVGKPIAGVPQVVYAGQGGLLDVAVHPDFATNRYVYLSYAEAGANGTSGLAVGRGKLLNGKLQGFTVIWRQFPKLSGSGQFGAHMAFAPDKTLFVTAGDRVAINYVQALDNTIGKVVHLNDDGTPVATNPYFGADPNASAIWSIGHRNEYGLAFDAAGQLWEHENGPQGGDELNLIQRGANYGWPVVSNGRNYGSPTDDIPNHDTHPEFAAPKVWWDPSIAPAGLIIYSGKKFPQFKGNAFVGALAGQELTRIVFGGTGTGATETARYAMGTRIRDLAQGADGSIYALEDGSSGRLFKLTPK